MSTTTKPTRSTRNTKGPRKSSSLPSETVEYLKAWMMSPEHIAHPYPTEPEKAQIMADTGIEMKQLTNWFVNNRKRYWKPRVEARLQQQARAAAAAAHAHAAAVAAVTAAAHTTPVSPDPASKPTLTIPPGDSFVTFDLAASMDTVKKDLLSSRHLVGTSIAQVMADRQSSTNVDERVVSESSSNSSTASSSSSDDDEEEDEELHDSTTHHDETSLQVNVVSQESLVQQPTGESSASMEDVTVIDNTSRPSTTSTKRSSSQATIQSPRKKYRRVSLELWRESCQNASHAYDEDLPTLEEATQLFGYLQ